MRAPTEARVREIVREELAHAGELGQEPGQSLGRDTGSAFQSFYPVVESDDTGRHHRRQFLDELAQFLRGYLRVVTTDGAKVGELVENDVAGCHGVGDLVDKGPQSGAGVVGCDYDASPSFGVDSQSVGGERPGLAEHVGSGRPLLGGAL